MTFVKAHRTSAFFQRDPSPSSHLDRIHRKSVPKTSFFVVLFFDRPHHNPPCIFIPKSVLYPRQTFIHVVQVTALKGRAVPCAPSSPFRLRGAVVYLSLGLSITGDKAGIFYLSVS